MTRAELLTFLRSHRHAVEASSSTRGHPQAAIVGVAVSDDFELIFDTLTSTRKWKNLHQNPAVALVFGGSAVGEERTVQYEGVADEPTGEERAALLRLYFATFADGRQRQAWPSLGYVRVKPTWLRWSDYGKTRPQTLEFTAEQLRALE